MDLQPSVHSIGSVPIAMTTEDLIQAATEGHGTWQAFPG
jgi:hypothetical protein